MRKTFRTYHLAVEFYGQAEGISLPRFLKDQLQRASSSVVLNLAEGRGRETMADQRRFYRIAFGSLRECQAILDLCSSANPEAVATADRLAAHIYKLIKNVKAPSR